MKTKNLIAISAAVVLFSGLLSGCATNSSTVDPKTSAEPTTSPTTTENDPYDPIAFMQKGKARAVQSDLDEEFLTIALNSCSKAYQDGLIYTNSDGVSYFQRDPADLQSTWRMSQVTVTKEGVISPGLFLNYFPALFDPCDTMIQGAILPEDTDSLVLEHSLKKNSDGSYTWGQHHGGASLDEVTYRVSDNGLFSSIGNGFHDATADYGPLTQEQLDYFK